MHSSSYHGEHRSFENGETVPTADFDFDDIDRRLGWSESGEPKQKAVTASANASYDVDADTPIAKNCEHIVKLLSMLLASCDTRLELLTMCSAFGMSALLGGMSFSQLAAERGISKQAYSRRVIRIQESFGLPVGRGQKSKAARATYSKVQKEIWQRPERQPELTLKAALRFAEPTGCHRRA